MENLQVLISLILISWCSLHCHVHVALSVLCVAVCLRDILSVALHGIGPLLCV